MMVGRRLSFALPALLAACGSSDKPAPPPDTAGPVVALAPVVGDTTCPRDGRWALCSVFKSIERAGLNVHRDSAKAVTEKPLSIAGTSLPIARGEIRIFLYDDSLSRLRDEAKLDKTQFIRPVDEPGFKRERTIVHSANALVLVNVLNSLQRERIMFSILAGPPQPPSNKP
jgi:hypothetical protein